MSTPYYQDDDVTIWHGNALALPIPNESVDLIVTSPPYFGLRSYTDGGQHYAGQIGSEATPGEFVDALIAATDEMVRVLKPSGSIWVNLGDSYSRGQPLDNTLTVADAGWLAGMVDSDGCITVRRTQQPSMRAPSYEGVLAIEQVDREGVDRAHRITGRGKVHTVTGSRGKPMYRWTVSTQQARWVAERIWPFLRIKQRQALAITELARHREVHSARGRYNPIQPEWTEYRERICTAVRAWNQREHDDWEPPPLPVIDLPLRPRIVPPKGLTGLPWRYALRCIDELGLILRAEVIWSKPNGLPESVTDRVRRSHEQWFHFTAQPRYFSAVDEIREEHALSTTARAQPHRAPVTGTRDAYQGMPAQTIQRDQSMNPLGKLPGSVWEIPTQPLTVPAHLGVDHFAAFPMEWPRRIIRGWSPSGICVECGEGRRPVTLTDLGIKERDTPQYDATGHARHGTNGSTLGSRGPSARIAGYACSCDAPTAPTRPSVVLDPFGGTGTTALVAKALGRRGWHVDLSADYCRLAQWRVTDPGEMARAMQVEKPPPAPEDMDSLLDLLGEAS